MLPASSHTEFGSSENAANAAGPEDWDKIRGCILRECGTSPPSCMEGWGRGIVSDSAF